MINWEVAETKQSLCSRGTVLEFVWRTEEKITDTFTPESRLHLRQQE
jgi:hypothetical protein